MAKEATARIKINKLLEAAGWRFFDNVQGKANILLENNAKITKKQWNEWGDNFEKTTQGFIDYLLLDEKGFPFIVLEAKKAETHPLLAKEQARNYALAQNCRFVILSNGDLHYFWDLKLGHPRPIQTFPPPQTVEGYLAFKPKPPALINEEINEDYIVRTQKQETILDPACGTAGFLISAYKYIVAHNTKKSPGDLLTPDNRKKLMNHLVGYDISPDMVRLSLVNLYLHGFVAPKIHEYDTLTSEERWGEYADIVLANPPFMTPKGGIKPHKRFSIQATKSEVLFTDYIVEHIHPVNGRAAVIVPNGIVATTQNAYKQLRKLLINQGLLAVISLPSGIFQPYSGVKTSILVVDKRLAKQTSQLLFVKIENDGFDLGAQRRPIEKNDFPAALELIQNYQLAIKHQETLEGLPSFAQLVEKSAILENKDVSLSAERYFVNEKLGITNYEMVRLGDVCEFKRGTSITKKDIQQDGDIPVIAGGQRPAYFHNVSNRPANAITVSSSGAYAGFVNFHSQPIFASDCFTIAPKNQDELEVTYLFRLLKSKQEKIYSFQVGGGQPHVYPRDFEDFEIPLPPLEVQQEIVAKIEKFQAIINGAKQVVENYQPQIEINPEWEMVGLGEVCAPKIGIKAGPFGSSLKKSDYTLSGYKIYGQEQVIAGDITVGNYYISEEKFQELKSCNVLPNDVLVSLVGTIGKSIVVPKNAPLGIINPRLLRIRPTDSLSPTFLRFCLQQDFVKEFFKKESSGGTMEVLNGDILKRLVIPLPPLPEQEEIVARIEKEQALVNANKELMAIFEGKIKAEIAKVWGSD